MNKNYQKWKDRLPKRLQTILALIAELIISAFFGLITNFAAVRATSQSDLPIQSIMFVLVVSISVLLMFMAFDKRSTILAALSLFVLGCYTGVQGYFIAHPETHSLSMLAADFYANVSTELLSITITVFIIDLLNDYRQSAFETQRMAAHRNQIDHLETRLFETLEVNTHQDKSSQIFLVFISVALVILSVVISIFTMKRANVKSSR